MHIYIYIHTYAYAYTHMHIVRLSKHAEEQLLRLTIYEQICIHTHIHVRVHAYVHIYTYTCIYIHLYMSVHIHTYTDIHTHVHMHACKHVWNHGASATAPEVWLDTRKLCTCPCPMQSGEGLPSVASSPIACLWGTTDKRRTTTTNSSSSHHSAECIPDYNRSSSLVRSWSTQFMAHPSCEPRRRPLETRSRFCHFGGVLTFSNALAAILKKKLPAMFFVGDKFYLTKYRPRIEKSHSKRHELSFCSLVSIVIVLTAPQKSNYLHYW